MASDKINFNGTLVDQIVLLNTDGSVRIMYYYDKRQQEMYFQDKTGHLTPQSYGTQLPSVTYAELKNFLSSLQPTIESVNDYTVNIKVDIPSRYWYCSDISTKTRNKFQIWLLRALAYRPDNISGSRRSNYQGGQGYNSFGALLDLPAATESVLGTQHAVSHPRAVYSQKKGFTSVTSEWNITSSDGQVIPCDCTSVMSYCQPYSVGMYEQTSGNGWLFYFVVVCQTADKEYMISYKNLSSLSCEHLFINGPVLFPPHVVGISTSGTTQRIKICNINNKTVTIQYKTFTAFSTQESSISIGPMSHYTFSLTWNNLSKPQIQMMTVYDGKKSDVIVYKGESNNITSPNKSYFTFLDSDQFGTKI